MPVTAPLTREESGVERRGTLSGNTVVGALVLTSVATITLTIAPVGSTAVINGAICLSLLGCAALATARVHGRLSEGLALGLLMPWFALVFIATFGLSTLAWLEQPQGIQMVISPSSIPAAIVLAAVGIGSTTVGYLVGAVNLGPVGTSVGRMMAGRPKLPTMAGAWLLYGIWASATLLLIRQGNFGYLQNVSNVVADASPYTRIVTLAAGFGPMAIVVAAWGLRRRPTIGWFVTLWLFVLTEAGAALLSGVKENIVLVAVAVLLGRGVRIGALPLRRVVIVVGLLLVIAVPVVTAYREVVNSGGSRLTPMQVLSNVIGIGAQTQAESSVRKANQRGPFDDFLWREARISDLAVIVQRTPSEIPYLSDSQLLEAPVLGVVPRLIWPSKPVLTQTLDFSHEYYHLPRGLNSSSAITPTGDLYRHGGYVIVILGSLALGAFMALLDLGGAALRDPRWPFIALALFVVVMKQEMDYVSMASTIPFALLTTAIGMRVAGVGTPPIPLSAQPEA